MAASGSSSGRARSAAAGSLVPAGRERRGGVRASASQAAKPGAGERVTKVVSEGSSRDSSSTTCLIRKLPNETPRRPGWQLLIE